MEDSLIMGIYLFSQYSVVSEEANNMTSKTRDKNPKSFSNNSGRESLFPLNISNCIGTLLMK